MFSWVFEIRGPEILKPVQSVNSVTPEVVGMNNIEVDQVFSGMDAARQELNCELII